MRRGPEGKGAGSKMPWEGLPLLPLGGPRKDQPRYPAAAWRQIPLDGSPGLPTHGLCIRSLLWGFGTITYSHLWVFFGNCQLWPVTERSQSQR